MRPVNVDRMRRYVGSRPPRKVVTVNRAQVAAAKLRIDLDRKRGVETDPRIVKIANARRPDDLLTMAERALP